ncbi:hypothetical protein [Desulfonatronospira sp.]|uniref:hypothetical protein n=1 Tax=Desulfonatronospira sp. TaxID=1962951 RepID=UPI0025B916EE|nr:hypothetical protein [Desulfonatronospira sp.]
MLLIRLIYSTLLGVNSLASMSFLVYCPGPVTPATARPWYMLGDVQENMDLNVAK